MIKRSDVIRDYISKVSDDELSFLKERLSARLAGDLAAVLDILSKNKVVDQYISSSNSSDEIYNVLDMFEEQVNREFSKRNN